MVPNFARNFNEAAARPNHVLREPIDAEQLSGKIGYVERSTTVQPIALVSVDTPQKRRRLPLLGQMS